MDRLERLNFASFFSILKSGTIGFKNYELSNMLLGCIYKTVSVYKKQAEGIYKWIDDRETSRFINQKDDIPETLRVAAGQKRVMQKAPEYFESNVVEFLDPDLQGDMFDSMFELIATADNIDGGTRTRLMRLAEELNTPKQKATYLANVFLFAVKQKNIEDKKASTKTADVTTPILEDDNAKLRDYLTDVLKQKRSSHPSFQLLAADEIDRRLHPNINEYELIEPKGTIPADSASTNVNSCPIWKIIKNSWSEPKHQNIVITGHGGIGKTVALFSIADTLEGETSVPALYIPMYELVDKNGEILELDEYIAKRYKRYSDRIDALVTEAWDDRPRLLILLDGFDEISFPLRREAIYKVNKWLEMHLGAQVIAVSRPMDGLNLAQELTGDLLPIELTPLEEGTIRSYLGKVGSKVPKKTSPIWEVLKYPLFLNLYIRIGRLKEMTPAGYPLSVIDAVSGGALIWNFLQRELLRYSKAEPRKTEDWVLRCVVVNEYILPYLAYRMVSEQRMEIDFKQANAWIKEALVQFSDEKLPHHLKTIRDVYEQNHGSVPDKNMFSFVEWQNTVLRESGILIPHENHDNRTTAVSGNYVFVHQHFRDCLAGLYLVNQAEMAKEKLPEVWRRSQNHLVLDYAAALMDESTANRLWEFNRKMVQYNSHDYVNDHSGTLALLELQKRRKPLPKDFDFSGIDLRGLSLARYLAEGADSLPLFQEPHHSKGTKLDRSTFQNEGHTAHVSCVIVLPNGQVISGSHDKSLRVWSSSTGQCLQTLEGHTGEVICAAEIPNSGHVVSGSQDQTLRMWDPSTGQCIRTLKKHTDTVSCVAVLNEWIVSGSFDHTLRVWSSSTGQYVKTLDGHTDRISCVAVHNGWVISGSFDHTLRVWDSSTWQCLHTLEGHTGRVYCVAVLSDGRIVSGSDDHYLRVWDSSTGRCLQTLKGHSSRISCVAVLKDGHIISGSYDRTLRVWDPNTGECLKILKKHTHGISCIVVLPDGRFVSGSYDKSLRVWIPSTWKCLQTLEKHDGKVSCVAALQSGQIVSGSEDRSLRVWDSSTGRCLQTLEGHSNRVYCVTVLKDGRIVNGSYDHYLRVWDPSSGRCLQTLKGHSSRVNCVDILKDGRIVSGSYDHFLRVWDPSKGHCLEVLEGHSNRVYCVAALPDGRIVSGSGDRSLKVWEPSTGRCLQTLKGHSRRVNCVAILKDRQLIVSGSYDRTLRVWDPNTGDCLQVLKGHSSRISCVSVLKDRQLIVSGSYDRTLRVWDPNTGDCLQVLKGHSGRISCVTVLKDGLIISGSYDRTLRVWDPNTGDCLQVLKGHSNRVYCVAVLKDEEHIVSGSEDHSLRVWDPLKGQFLQELKGHSSRVSCVDILPNGHTVSGSMNGIITIVDPKTGRCTKAIETTEIDVSQMDLSYAILEDDLEELLWQNGAKVP